MASNEKPPQDWDEKTATESKASSDEVDPKLVNALENPREILKVVQEGLIIAGGAAAILLQVANPGVAKGVDGHSYFESRPLGRLRTTMIYIYSVLFGTKEEKAAIVAMVHEAHSQVKGADYTADDPQLQVWVAATLYVVGTDLYQRVFGKFDEATAETLYLEYATLATALRVPPEMWPKSREAFWNYWNEQVDTLEVTDAARNVAKGVLHNKNIPIFVRPAMPLMRNFTAQLLPPRIREGFGLKSTRLGRGVHAATIGMLKVTYPALPKAVRTYPKRYYMKDMRRRIANHA